MRSSLFKSVMVTDFQATEAYTYSSLDLTKAKYSINTLAVVENEDVIVRTSPSNFITCEKEDRQDHENEVYNQYAHPNTYV
jgi:hypothetical protein